MKSGVVEQVEMKIVCGIVRIEGVRGEGDNDFALIGVKLYKKVNYNLINRTMEIHLRSFIR